MDKKSASNIVDDITQLPLEARKSLSERYMSETKGHFPFVIQKEAKSTLHCYEKPKM